MLGKIVCLIAIGLVTKEWKVKLGLARLLGFSITFGSGKIYTGAPVALCWYLVSDLETRSTVGLDKLC